MGRILGCILGTIIAVGISTMPNVTVLDAVLVGFVSCSLGITIGSLFDND